MIDVQLVKEAVKAAGEAPVPVRLVLDSRGVIIEGFSAKNEYHQIVGWNDLEKEAGNPLLRAIRRVAETLEAAR